MWRLELPSPLWCEGVRCGWAGWGSGGRCVTVSVGAHPSCATAPAAANFLDATRDQYRGAARRGVAPSREYSAGRPLPFRVQPAQPSPSPARRRASCSPPPPRDRRRFRRAAASKELWSSPSVTVQSSEAPARMSTQSSGASERGPREVKPHGSAHGRPRTLAAGSRREAAAFSLPGSCHAVPVDCERSARSLVCAFGTGMRALPRWRRVP